MIRLVTYTDDRMTISAEKLRISALKHGANEVRVYTPADLSDDFKEKMKEVLACEKGAGFYCWKPFCVNDAIQDLTSQDTLMWSDAGTEIIQPLSFLDKELISNDNLFFSNGWRHVDWCKMDLIKLIWPNYGLPGVAGEHITEIVGTAKQVQASQFLITGRSRMKQFVKEWLEIATKPGMIDNNPSILPNDPTFQEHRWDQSILGCLQILYGLKLHWFPSNYGYHLKDQHPEDTYPAMFNHHRKRNNEW